MVLTRTLAYALSKVLVVTWFSPQAKIGPEREEAGCFLPIECPLPAGFLALSQCVHMPSLLFLGCLFRVLRAPGLVYSGK